MKCRIYLRHGINSQPAALSVLQSHLAHEFAGQPFDINNDPTEWTRPVLYQGLTLARLLAQDLMDFVHVVLVGHSQGGLVCRAAVAAISDLLSVEKGIRKASIMPYGVREEILAELRRFSVEMPETDRKALSTQILGVVTLATPNSGAFTFGQMSMTGRTVSKVSKAIASAFRCNDLDDLTTDRLFKVLQFVKVPETIRYLTVSGSLINRYTPVNHQDLDGIPILKRLGVHLEFPNDGVVEDLSVDLSEAPLPPEMHIHTQCEHVRQYLHCTAVGHSAIHSHDPVLDLVTRRIREWVGAADGAGISTSIVASPGVP